MATSEQDNRKLTEAVEAGLRDGRSLDSLRKAMEESGYSKDEIRGIISNVDRKRTVRRPQRKGESNKAWVAAAVVIIVAVGVGFFMFARQPGGEPESATGPNVTAPPQPQEVRTCYVVNESIKQIMVDAGAQCDKWFLIKEI